jgi:hypothetical protein
MGNDVKRVAILYPGDAEARRNARPETSRFLKLFQAFESLGVKAEPAVYHDDFCKEVQQQLLRVRAVLVWCNPIEGGRERTLLDAMLREVAAAGVYVSTHPDVILKLGTKDVLYRTRDMGWGCDTHRYASLDEMRRELPARLARGEARVLKQYRGHSGDGIWRVELASPSTRVTGSTLVRARHAKRGCDEEVISLDTFHERCAPYFAALNGEGRMIDQVYQTRLPDGMVRCYLVHGRVEGFGHQAVVALHPTEPQTTPRYYHPPTMPEFQRLKRILEMEWVPQAQRLLQIGSADLPALWDCDFMFGPKNAAGEDSYVLCEINVSSVSPFPDSAVGPLASAVVARMSG